MSSKVEEFGKRPFGDYFRRIHIPGINPGFKKEDPSTGNEDLLITPLPEQSLILVSQDPILPIKETGGREKDIDWWKNALVKYKPTDPFVGADGKLKPAGILLLVGEKKRQYQVMHTCEIPWVENTVEMMFEGQPEGIPLRTIERGAGLRISTKRIVGKMAKRGGESILVELNQRIYNDTVVEFEKGIIPSLKRNQELGWYPKMEIEFISGTFEDERIKRYINQESPLEKSRLTIVVIQGEADQVTTAFPKRHFHRVFSDTYPLNPEERPEERGINDLLALGPVTERMRDDAAFTFPTFKEGDLKTDSISREQWNLISIHFRDKAERIVDLYVPPEVIYLPKPIARVSALRLQDIIRPEAA